MKIDSVMTMEVKTRNEELEELLAPSGALNCAVYDAVNEIVCAARDPEIYCNYDSLYTALDNAINTYMKYAIEYDRLTRK